MDPATIIGIVLAFGAVLGSMILEGSSPMAIVLLPALLLVFVGTFAAAMAGSTLPDTIAVLKGTPKYLLAKITPPGSIVDVVVSMAERARREGLLALEDAAKEVSDPFLKRGLELAIDGADSEELYQILESEIRVQRNVDKIYSKFYADMGGYSPTIGIIGTVIGLIHVLGNLDQPAELGALIAGAFVATLWGVLAANVIWLPISKRIHRISELQCQQMELVVEGIMAIQAGSNPRTVAQKLRSLLPRDARTAEKAA
jgi:chemotaxis protein MotA